MTARPFLIATALFCGTALAGPTAPEAPRMTANTKAPPDAEFVWTQDEVDAEALRLLAPAVRDAEPEACTPEEATSDAPNRCTIAEPQVEAEAPTDVVARG